MSNLADEIETGRKAATELGHRHKALTQEYAADGISAEEQAELDRVQAKIAQLQRSLAAKESRYLEQQGDRAARFQGYEDRIANLEQRMSSLFQTSVEGG